MPLEYREPDQLVYRLAGTEIVRRIGVDFTGMNLFDTVLPKQAALTRRIFEAVRSHPCGVILHTKLKSKRGAEFISELVYLPLRDRQDNINQLVVVADVVKRDKRPVTAAEINAAEQVKAIKGLEFFFLDVGAGLPEIEASTPGVAV